MNNSQSHLIEPFYRTSITNIPKNAFHSNTHDEHTSHDKLYEDGPSLIWNNQID